MIDVSLVDIKNKNRVKIAPNRSLSVNILPPALPPLGSKNVFRYFQGLLGSEGLNKGTVNMNVDGSSNSQKFFVAAPQDSDIHILAIVIVIADNNVAHNDFGQIAALANGWDLIAVESGVESPIIDKAKTGGQVILQSGIFWPFGNAGTSFELTSFTGTTDATVINIPIGQIIPGGIRLGRGTTDEIKSIVNDDLTGLNNFSARVIGFKHFPFQEPKAVK